MRVFLNNRLIPSHLAKISIYDHGFMYGDGIFETLRSYNGTIFRLDQHLSRLEQSARWIHLKLPYSKKRLQTILYQTLTGNRLKEASLRLTISRGISQGKLDPERCGPPTLVVMARPLVTPRQSAYARGQKSVIVSTRKTGADSLNPRIKSINFLNNILAGMEARKAGADEGLMLNHEGYLTEGTVSNLFIIKKNRLYTPSSESGLLEGVTRGVVLELADRLNLVAKERRLTPNDLLKADECFITNTTKEIMPITWVGKTRIGGGKPGKITGMLRKEFRDLIRRECRIKKTQH